MKTEQEIREKFEELKKQIWAEALDGGISDINSAYYAAQHLILSWILDEFEED